MCPMLTKISLAQQIPDEKELVLVCPNPKQRRNNPGPVLPPSAP